MGVQLTRQHLLLGRRMSLGRGADRPLLRRRDVRAGRAPRTSSSADGAVLHGFAIGIRCGRHRGRDPRYRNVVGRVLRSARSLFCDRDAWCSGGGCRSWWPPGNGSAAASGISMPVFPGAPRAQKLFFYFLLFALAFVVLLFLRWLYSTNFGMAINAIRDDEEKAEAMGLHTRRYKRTAWSISPFFLGIAGAIFGNMTGFIDARDIVRPRPSTFS